MGPPARRALPTLALLATLTAPATSGAQAPPAGDDAAVALNWVRLPGAESCISPQALARAVEERVGRPVFVTVAEARWSLEGRVERARAAWVATVVGSRGGGTGARTITSAAPDCAALDTQLVLALALLVDPEGRGASAPPPAAPRANPPPPAAPPPAPPSPRAQPLPDVVARPALPAARWRFAAHLGVGYQSDLLPSSAVAPSAGAVWNLGILRLRAHVGGWLPVRVDAGVSAGAATFAGLFGDLSACAGPRGAAVSACAGLLVGAVHGEGESFGAAGGLWRFALGAAVRVDAELALGGPWALRASPVLVVPLVWPRFVAAGAEGAAPAAVFGPSAPVSAGAELALVARWPS